MTRDYPACIDCTFNVWCSNLNHNCPIIYLIENFDAIKKVIEKVKA